jgi:hypothetical protein
MQNFDQDCRGQSAGKGSASRLLACSMGMPGEGLLSAAAGLSKAEAS